MCKLGTLLHAILGVLQLSAATLLHPAYSQHARALPRTHSLATHLAHTTHYTVQDERSGMGTPAPTMPLSAEEVSFVEALNADVSKLNRFFIDREEEAVCAGGHVG